MVKLGPLALDLPRRGAMAGPIKLAVRPDAMKLSEGPETRVGEDAGQIAGLEGTIAKAAYLGKQREYTVSSAVGDLFIVDAGRAPPRAVGSTVHVGFSNSGIVVLPQ